MGEKERNKRMILTTLANSKFALALKMQSSETKTYLQPKLALSLCLSFSLTIVSSTALTRSLGRSSCRSCRRCCWRWRCLWTAIPVFNPKERNHRRKNEKTAWTAIPASTHLKIF